MADDIDDFFNLAEFEQDFAAGKFDSLVKKVKAPAKPKTQVKVSQRGGLEIERNNEPRLNIEDPAVAAIFLYRHLDCICCGGRTTFISAKMIKYAKGLRTSYKHVGVGDKQNSLSKLWDEFESQGKLEAMEAVEKIEYCQDCIQMILLSTTGNENGSEDNNSDIGDGIESDQTGN